jgi:hypothetical protein
MMSGTGRNLMAAEAGMEWANSILRGRTTNRAEDLAHGAQQVLKNSSLTLKDETTKKGKQEAQLLFQKAVEVAKVKHDEWLENARDANGNWNVTEILNSRMGNCREHSLLVGHHIRTNYTGVTAHFLGIPPPWDHAFVIVGAPATLPTGIGAVTLTFPDPPPILGADAFVADAWWHELFPAKPGPWGQKLGHILLQTCHDKSLALPDSLVFDCFLLT